MRLSEDRIKQGILHPDAEVREMAELADRRSSSPRWYHLTPDRLLVALLPAVGLLWLSEQFRWFPFNEHKNWTVLIAAAVVCLAVVLFFLWLGVSLVFRCRFQFGIRSLLVLVTVVAVVCSWFSVKMQQAERQREVVEKVDGYARYDYLFDADGNDLPGTPEPPGPPWLRNLVGVDFLCDVVLLINEQATDAELERLKGMASLQGLALMGTQVTDAGLVHLQGLPNLQALGLESPQVTDAGLVHLKELASPQMLALQSPQVTDAGLVHLEGLTSLQHLHLEGTQVTDAGLVHLKGLTSLQYLCLFDTQVTDVGVKKLQRALPNCTIYYR